MPVMAMKWLELVYREFVNLLSESRKRITVEEPWIPA